MAEIQKQKQNGKGDTVQKATDVFACKEAVRHSIEDFPKMTRTSIELMKLLATRHGIPVDNMIFQEEFKGNTYLSTISYVSDSGRTLELANFDKYGDAKLVHAKYRVVVYAYNLPDVMKDNSWIFTKAWREMNRKLRDTENAVLATVHGPESEVGDSKIDAWWVRMPLEIPIRRP